MLATADDTVFGVFSEGDLFVHNHFAIKAEVHTDGSASGNATFRFGAEFSNAWAADVMTLKCEINSGTVAEDGTIEAIRIADAPGFALGVQWHAEYDPQSNPINRVLFQAFGSAAAARKRAA